MDSSDMKLCNYVKTSPEGGLVWRLSVTAARLHDAGGIPYLAHLWYEFVQELQYRWERHILVPGYVFAFYIFRLIFYLLILFIYTELLSLKTIPNNNKGIKKTRIKIEGNV